MMIEPMAAPSRAEWEEIGRLFRAPFAPAEVDFRVQGKANEQTNRAQVVAYIDARAVQDRLDEVVGPGAWSFDWTPMVTEKGDLQVVKGTLTIHGVGKADVGTASNFEQSLGAISHCFKRAAVHWGIGRYLYALPTSWVVVERGGRIPDATLKQLRASLPTPTGSPRTPPTPRTPPGVGMEEEEADGAAEPREVARVGAAGGATAPARSIAHSATATAAASAPTSLATVQQMQSIQKLRTALGHPTPIGETLTQAEAAEVIAALAQAYNRAKREE